jgi:hypothetical protein
MSEADIVPADKLPPDLVPENKLPQELREPKSVTTPQGKNLGFPIPRTEDIGKGSWLGTVLGLPGKVGNFALPGVLPTAGAIGGAAIGGLPGEMIGSGMGEAANQVLGLTPRSNLALAVAGGIPGLPKLIPQSVKQGAGRLAEGLFGKMAGREVMSDAATKTLNKLVGVGKGEAVPGANSAAELYARAGEFTQNVATKETGPAVQAAIKSTMKRLPSDLRDKVMQSLEPLRSHFETVERMVEEAPMAAPRTKIVMGESGVRGMEQPAAQAAAKVTTKTLPKEIPAQELVQYTQDLRIVAGDLYKAGNHEGGRAIDSIRNAIFDDLEAHGGGIARQAAQAARREAALKNVSNLLGKPRPGIKFAEAINKDAFFAKAFTGPEQDQIRRIAAKLEAVPAVGGGGELLRMILAGAGAVEGGIPGAVVGYVAPTAFEMMMKSPVGRNAAERILSGAPGKAVSPEQVAMLLTFMRGMGSGLMQHGQTPQP